MFDIIWFSNIVNKEPSYFMQSCWCSLSSPHLPHNLMILNDISTPKTFHLKIEVLPISPLSSYL